MKTVRLILLFSVTGSVALCQSPTHEQKLYYTCKVWGFVKYHHTRVSNCLAPWDDALIRTLPLIEAAATSGEFNDALDTLIAAAGHMSEATTPSPDTLAPELTRNRDFSWFDDPPLSENIRSKLRHIRDNFRPHPICWVRDSATGGAGWLAFPGDDPMLDGNITTSYPGKATRLAVLFRYWNIMNYFNPNKHILAVPWDSTLYRALRLIADAATPTEFFHSFRKMAAGLDDAHTEGLTTYALTYSSYTPRLVLRYSQGAYIVVKSGYPEIARGDILLSVDGKTTAEWEDSLRPFISAGNPAVFRRFMCQYMLWGPGSSLIRLEYRDSVGRTSTFSTYRYSYADNAWFTGYFPNAELDTVEWRKWDCNVGYVNMGKLQPSSVTAMFDALRETSAIIFDVRNYPNGTANMIADLFSRDSHCFVKFTQPDARYPGAFSWHYSFVGRSGNPLFYKGKVIILCDQQTQSHAEYSCMILQSLPNAVVVGSSTAGADGNVAAFRISNDIRAGYTALGTYYPDGSQTQKIGIVPDSVVYPTAEGIRRGRDEVLEKALEIAGCSIQTGISDVPADAGSIRIYPNPARDEALARHSFDEHQTLSIRLANERGVCVARYRLSACDAGYKTVAISTSALVPGLYFLTLEADGTVESVKFLVVR